MRYGAEHKQETRARVLDAAAKAIHEDGPHVAGVAEVMKAAGLTHGGFYAHFASKDAMLAAAIGRMFEGAVARWARDTTGKSAADGLAAFVERYLSRSHRDARTSGCPIAALGADLPRMTDACREAFAEGARAMHARLAGALAELQMSDADALASSVMAELVGALSLARGEPDVTRSDAYLASSKRAIAARLGLPAAAMAAAAALEASLPAPAKPRRRASKGRAP